MPSNHGSKSNLKGEKCSKNQGIHKEENARLGSQGDFSHGIDYLGMASYVPHFLRSPNSTKCFTTIPMGTQQRRGKD
jgi:hypothetical protein